jgi:superfamily I DNA and/or RNA helicase
VDLSPLLLIDTAGCDFDEQQNEDDDSKHNQGEAQAALAHAERLLAAGLAPTDVGIIAPYSAQVGHSAAITWGMKLTHKSQCSCTLQLL